MALLKAFNKPSVLWIRVNTLKTSVSELVERLKKRGVIVEKDGELDDVLKVVRGASTLPKIPEYTRGLFYIQDKASAIVAHEVGAGERDIVLDLCSATGSKATHAAQQYRGYVIGVDISLRRTFIERKVVEVLSLKQFIDLCVSDARYPPIRKADKIIINPDCSALGKLGHSPEIRLWIGRNHVRKYAELRKTILRNTVLLAKRDCEILYSTCTLTLEEDENNIEEILDEFEVELANIKYRAGDNGIGLPETMRLYPHKHDTRGFFLAKLVKQ